MLILIYIAGFSVRQSIVLALVFIAFAHGMSGFAPKPAQKFRPYRVSVAPDYYRILSDFHLGTREQWQQLQEDLQETAPPRACIWRYGIGFTVASQSEDGELTLVYSDNHKYFTSIVRFEEDMSPFHVERVEKVAGLPDCQRVSLFIRPGGASRGYDLGISVPDRWWGTVKGSCPRPIREEHRSDYVDLVLATLSHREFDLYWEPAVWNYDYYTKTLTSIENRRDEYRTKLGWEAQKYSFNCRDTIRHRYFLVEHHAI